MANYEIPENLGYEEEIRKLESSDPAHADLFNNIFEKIIGNIAFLKHNSVLREELGIPEGESPSVENQVPVIPESPVIRENIADGDNMGTILAKVRKWLGDLKSVAFSGSYKDLSDKPSIANNLTTTAAGYALDARQGKVLQEGIDQISSDLTDSGKITGYEVREGDGVYITYLDGADTVVKKLGSPDYAYPLLPRMTGANYTNVKTDLFQPTENSYTITATTLNHDNMPLFHLWNYALGNFYRMFPGAQEIIIKCTKPIRLQKVLFGIRQAHWSWNSCTIYASNNGIDYTNIGSVSENAGVRFVYDISAPDYYYFYKFCFPATNDYKDIDTLELYGNIAD